MATSGEKLKGNNLYVVLMLVSLLVLGITALVAKSLIVTIVRDTKVVSAKSKAKSQLSADLTAAPQLVDAYSGLGSQAQVLSDALPSTADFPDLIVALQNMTTESGLQLKSVSPTDSTTATTTPVAPTATTSSSAGPVPPAPQSYAFTVTVGGSYTGVQKLLGAIENSARPMRVEGVQLSGSGTAISGEINLETFYQAKAQLPFGEETIK